MAKLSTGMAFENIYETDQTGQKQMVVNFNKII